MTLQITHDKADGRLRLSGELTIYEAAELKDALLQGLGTGHSLEIDLSEVEALDAAVLQVLMAAKLQANRDGRDLRMVGHSPAALDVLEVAGLSAFFGDPLVLTAKPHS